MSAATAPPTLERPAAAAALDLRNGVEQARYYLGRFGAVEPVLWEALVLLLERMIVELPPSGPPA